MTVAKPDQQRAAPRSIPAAPRPLIPGLVMEPAGRIVECRGTIVQATGVDAGIGQLCEIELADGTVRCAEVVGLVDNGVLLAPHGGVQGIAASAWVRSLHRGYGVVVTDALLGRIVDGYGMPIDKGEPLVGPVLPVRREPPPPLERLPISEVLVTGVRAIDGLLTMGKGQRLCIVAPAGVGKTTLAKMLVQGANADVCVVALIGERGREVGEFVARVLTPEVRARTVLVVATSDRSASERFNAGLVATTIAEHFRDQGRHVLLIMDSITRLARALREIGLANNEPPTRRGYPPTVFAELPRLLERSGTGTTGAITALFTILADGDAEGDPIAEDVRATVDGHIMLSRELSERGHYPAIDVLASLSRMMNALAADGQRARATRLRALLAKYAEIELLLQVGEYETGVDALGDEAVKRHDAILAFLAQPENEQATLADTLKQLAGIT